MIATMAATIQFLQYWALAFVSLCAALALLSGFYRLIDSDLGLHGLRKEVVIAVVASAIQGASYWFAVSVLQMESAWKWRATLLPMAAVGIIYLLAHLEDWSGYEMGGISLFQAVILATGLCLFGGQFGLAIIILSSFLLGLAVIAGVAKSC